MHIPEVGMGPSGKGSRILEMLEERAVDRSSFISHLVRQFRIVIFVYSAAALCMFVADYRATHRTHKIDDAFVEPISPIDSLVQKRLTNSGLRPSEPADRRTLIRRVYFDLIGLPPSPEEVAEFESTTDERAYEKIVDKLLASDHYGEHWAAHWLNVVHHAESDGFEWNTPRRNAWRYRDWVIRSLNSDTPYDEFARLQLAGDVRHPDNPSAVAASGFLVSGAIDATLSKNDAARAAAREDELESIVGAVSETFLAQAVRCARCHDHKTDPITMLDYRRFAASLAGVGRGEREVNGEIIYAAMSITPTPILLPKRGGEGGQVVAPGGIAALHHAPHEFGPGSLSDAERRGRLAEWITHKDNKLFTRVMMNRIWRAHFGAGLMESENDFGGDSKPSHPELLELLEKQFIVDGYRLKSLHKFIVMSRTYCQSSKPRGECLAIDAENRLLWRMSPRPMNGELLRDSMLAVSGRLDRSVGGPGFSDYRETIRAGATSYEPDETTDHRRRSVYSFMPRDARQDFVASFISPCGAPTVHQAAAMWNGAVVIRAAEALADRAIRDKPNDVEAQIRECFHLVFQREPEASELRHARALVEEHGLRALTRVLFNTREFMMIE